MELQRINLSRCLQVKLSRIPETANGNLNTPKFSKESPFRRGENLWCFLKCLSVALKPNPTGRTCVIPRDNKNEGERYFSSANSELFHLFWRETSFILTPEGEANCKLAWFRHPGSLKSAFRKLVRRILWSLNLKIAVVYLRSGWFHCVIAPE